MKSEKISNIEFTIKRAKVKEIKQLWNEFVEKSNFLVNAFSNDNFAETLASDNFDFVIEKIAQFTTLSEEIIDDMEFLDLIEVIKKVLEHNGVNLAKIREFIKKNIVPLLTAAKQPTHQMEETFSHPIPSIKS